MKNNKIIILSILFMFIIGCNEGLRYDPIDRNPAYAKILEEVDKEIKENPEYKEIEGMFGSCHTYWRLKKRILKKKYNINWRSPKELNPGVMFD